MYIPSATYRVQLSNKFDFKKLNQIVDYLYNLGISTVYASPILQATPGSQHGYDVINPERINPEIGSWQELKQINRKLHDKNMGWLQDMVPNHMAFSFLNPWLRDIMEKGPDSKYYEFFDITWKNDDSELDGKMMAPFLGAPLEEILGRKEIAIHFDHDGFSLKYYDQQYPLSLKSYYHLMLQVKSILQMDDDIDGTLEQEIFKMLEQSENLQDISRHDYDKVLQFKKDVNKMYQANSSFTKLLDKTLSKINQDQAYLQYLLEFQYFLPCHWQETEKRINYRRFFTINDLISLRMQDEDVFQQYHAFLKTLFDQDLIHGLRVDHIDGLFNPNDYLQKVRDHFGKDLYLVVEKILEWEESLPIFWPAQGTTGYGFLASVSHLFTDWRNKERFNDIYKDLVGEEQEYHDLVMEKKYFIIKERMGGELNNLIMLMKQLQLYPDEGRFEDENFAEALAVFMIAHPVYRIYPTQYPLSQGDLSMLKQAYLQASNWRSELKKELKYIFDLFTETRGSNKLINDNKLFFLMRSQQFTGPLEAKGVEDTTFYLYNRLISHNEVGDSPEIFGISFQEFHEKMMARQVLAPHALSATATHDTKRGEDMRVRTNIISELPDEWHQAVKQWKQINMGAKKSFNGKQSPDDNDEYFIYQTIVGALPMDGSINEELRQRLREYMTKVLREGKRNSSWSNPNQQYEFGVHDFLNTILQENSKFMQAARPFLKKVTHFGFINSLSQVLLKITAPGVPDVYQGTEFWDLNLVDPDNRRPVDYELREKILKDIQEAYNHDPIQLIDSLLQSKEDGRIKLFTLYKSLIERRRSQKLFSKGKYIPLHFSGSGYWHLVGYARHYQNQWALIVLPRHLVHFLNEGEYPHQVQTWEDTILHLPKGAPRNWRSTFSGRMLNFENQVVRVNELFTNFPIVFLRENHR